MPRGLQKSPTVAVANNKKAAAARASSAAPPKPKQRAAAVAAAAEASTSSTKAPRRFRPGVRRRFNIAAQVRKSAEKPALSRKSIDNLFREIVEKEASEQGAYVPGKGREPLALRISEGVISVVRAKVEDEIQELLQASFENAMLYNGATLRGIDVQAVAKQQPGLVGENARKRFKASLTSIVEHRRTLASRRPHKRRRAGSAKKARAAAAAAGDAAMSDDDDGAENDDGDDDDDEDDDNDDDDDVQQ